MVLLHGLEGWALFSCNGVWCRAFFSLDGVLPKSVMIIRTHVLTARAFSSCLTQTNPLAGITATRVIQPILGSGLQSSAILESIVKGREVRRCIHWMVSNFTLKEAKGSTRKELSQSMLNYMCTYLIESNMQSHPPLIPFTLGCYELVPGPDSLPPQCCSIRNPC